MKNYWLDKEFSELIVGAIGQAWTFKENINKKIDFNLVKIIHDHIIEDKEFFCDIKKDPQTLMAIIESSILAAWAEYVIGIKVSPFDLNLYNFDEQRDVDNDLAHAIATCLFHAIMTHVEIIALPPSTYLRRWNKCQSPLKLDS